MNESTDHEVSLVPSANRTSASSAVTLLILGDGDFSFSLDWARYLAQNPTIYPAKSLHLLATGLDSIEALLAKYKDSTFLVTRLKGLDKTVRRRGASVTSGIAGSGDDDDSILLHVSVHHGVNAICQTSLPLSNPLGHSRAQHVVFHHPHLGTEDAVLHSQFLCHLFHSVSTVWLENDNSDDAINCFHLTLVKGQFTRWKCAEAAERHGMMLVDRRPFSPPRVENPYYQHRRHQTGRSFAARASDGSETYTFTRQKTQAKTLVLGSGDGAPNKKKVAELVSMLLGTTGLERESADDNDRSNNNDCDSLLACPYCEKTFREERSRKCHVKAVHASDGVKKRKREDHTAYSCYLCRSKDGGGPRLFQSSQALEDHQKAKHLAKHNEIKPDWLKPSPAIDNKKDAGPTDTGNKSEEDFGCCAICGLKFTDVLSDKDHKNAFVPSDVSAPSVADKLDLLPFACSYCKKAFREERAQKQHENFCNKAKLFS